MFDGKFRSAVDARTAPVGQALNRLGVSADVLTASGLVFAAATAVAIATGAHALAVVLLTLTGAHDLFDGPVAKASHRASIRGAFFDSVIDRVSDGLLLGGCAAYLIAQHRGQLALLPFAIMTSTFMISYERAKAESLGLAAKGGLMERAERMILLGVGLLALGPLRAGAVALARSHDGDRSRTLPPSVAGSSGPSQARADGTDGAADGREAFVDAPVGGVGVGAARPAPTSREGEFAHVGEGGPLQGTRRPVGDPA
jgi:CDP-diacylglycerol--glycerol-3-phosphate 3-phosphatidyltransferase